MSETNHTHKNSNLEKHPLIHSSQTLELSLKIFHDINYKAQFISLNAAIEGARMKNKISTFSIVAAQISAQATRNEELSQKLEAVISRIKAQSLESLAIRNLEISADLIDKLDRNLFERNCDVQAWAGFEQVKNACISSLNLDTSNEETAKKAASLLENLVNIYVVYLDSFLINLNGVVVTAAKNQTHNQKNWSHFDWFNRCLSGNIEVTDLHLFAPLEKNTVLYCSPVKNDEGKIIGVLANCFDWEFAIEMIKSIGLSENISATFINSSASLIGSQRTHLILKDNFDWLRAGELASKGCSGYSLERLRNGEAGAIGFTHTRGYNSYPGKNWSAIVYEVLSNTQFENTYSITDSISGAQITLTKDKISQIESERASQELQNTMKDIDQLVVEVNANNRELRMLAVNASIQAGLAGSEGEGFSIIANEVAQLAQQSLKFVEQVNTTTSQLRASVDQSAAYRLVDAAKDTMSKIDRNLFERYCDIQAWATFSKFTETLQKQAYNEPETQALLEKIHRIYEVYHDIYLINLQGKTVGTATNVSLLGHNFSHKDWFKYAVNGQVSVTDIYQSETLGIPLMTFSSPVKDENGTVVGVIASRFNCNFLNDILKAAIIDSRSENFLINEKGIVIASKFSENIFKKSFADISIIKKGKTDNNGYLEEKSESPENSQSFGYSFSQGYNTYPGQKWVLVTRRPSPLKIEKKNKSPVELYQELRRGEFKNF